MRKWLLPLVLTPLLFLGAGCLGGGQQAQLTPVTLNYWRTEDQPSALDAEIAAYQKLHPNVNVKITTFQTDGYEEKLLAAIAEDRGPDIFSIPNVWMGAWRDKLLPMPDATTIPTRVVNKNNQVVVVDQKTPTLSMRDLINDYVGAVPNDVVMLGPIDKPGQAPKRVIYGLPLSFDTLAMYYNKDLLKKADIAKPPTTWRDFQDDVKRLTLLDKDGNISISGAAIGLAKNVRNSTDLMTAIMMQNGAEMTNASGAAQFDRYTPDTQGNPYPPGVEALIFYQSFALKGTSAYTWSADLPDSFDAFISGKTAFYFGYPVDRTAIAQQAPRLNFDVASLPQVDVTKKADIAHYNVEVVSKKTRNPDVAWDFIQFIARAENVKSFLDATGRPTALRSLISQQMTDATVAPFVAQDLTAKTWYHGTDWSQTVKAFDTMIETYPTVDHPEYQPIVAGAVNLVNTTMQ